MAWQTASPCGTGRESLLRSSWSHGPLLQGLRLGPDRRQYLCRGSRSRSLRVMAQAAEKTVLVPIGHGSEEMEAVAVVDVLRRAGALVTLVSVEDTLQVLMSRQVKLVADKSIADVAGEAFDLIVLPGGMPGSERLRDSTVLDALLKEQLASDKPISAICAAPVVVLESKGLLVNKKATAHPGFVKALTDTSAAEQRVVVDGNLVTSRGPGTAIEFALQLVQQLYGKDKAAEVAGPMVTHDFTLA